MTESPEGESARHEAVARWSAALRQVEVLKPWLTESHWDEHYWDDVAELVVSDARTGGGSGDARDALADALRRTFAGAALESDSGPYRERLDERLDMIARLASG